MRHEHVLSFSQYLLMDQMLKYTLLCDRPNPKDSGILDCVVCNLTNPDIFKNTVPSFSRVVHLL